MTKIYCISIALVVIVLIFGNNFATANPTVPATAPTEVKVEPAPAPYIPHATYPYSDTYGGSYFYPVAKGSSNESPSYGSAVIPAAQGALQVALRLFAKVGLFIMGGITLLLVGGIFTSVVCSLTPLCTFSFMGLGGIDKESMRSFMTPERINAAAAMVQDAIGKYQQLQRMTQN